MGAHEPGRPTSGRHLLSDVRRGENPGVTSEYRWNRPGRRPRSVPHAEVAALLLEVRVQSLGLDRATNTPVVILQELEGERVLPIWIGPGEASAIAMHMAEMEFARPLTHDLLCSVLRGLGGTLQKVVIPRVEESTYYAELHVRRNGDLISLDARPSDSIAVALRVKARIFVSDDLLEIATVEISEEEAAEASLGDAGPQPDPHLMGPDELKEHLRKLNPEDFGRFTP